MEVPILNLEKLLISPTRISMPLMLSFRSLVHFVEQSNFLLTKTEKPAAVDIETEPKSPNEEETETIRMEM